MTLLSKPADGKGFSGSKDNGVTSYHSIEQGSISHVEEVGNEGTVDWQYQKKSPYFRIVSAFVLIAGSAFALRNGRAPIGLSSGELVKASTASVLESCPPAPEQKARAGDKRPVLPNQVGKGFTSQYTRTDLMRGYKLSDKDGPLRGYIFKDPNNHPALRIEKTSGSFSTAQIIATRSDVNEVLGIDGELSVSYGPASGKGSGSFLDEQVSTETKVVVTVVDRTPFFQIKVAKNGHLEWDPDFKEFYDQGDMNVIYEHYGTYMTNAVQYGCSLYARYEITSETKIDREEIHAQLVGKIGKGPLEGEIKAKFDSQKGSEQSQLNLSITGIVQGVVIAFPNLSDLKGFDEANYIIGNYTAQKMALREQADGIGYGMDNINQLTTIFSPAAITLDSINTFVSMPEMDSNAVFWLNKKAKATGAIIQQTYLDEHRLEAERASFLEKFSGGRDYFTIYEPFELAQTPVLKAVTDKQTECLEFLLKPPQEILCDLESAPGKLESSWMAKIVGLLGGGWIDEPWGSDSLFYEGYTIVKDESIGPEPFYKGRLLCNDDDSIDQIGEARIKKLKQFVQNNPNPICYETESPTPLTPTQVPTARPTYAPTPTPPCIPPAEGGQNLVNACSLDCDQAGYDRCKRNCCSKTPTERYWGPNDVCTLECW